MFHYKVITDLQNISSKRVLLRLDLNVPIREKVEDHLRLTKALEMINYLRIQGAKIIVISHIGRDKDETLKPLVSFFEKYFPVKFAPNIFSEQVKIDVESLQNGDVLILENLRGLEGEKNNDDGLARYLASLADIYVNEAFSVSHRKHASIVGVPKYIESYAGIQFDKEVKNLSRVFHPDRPFVVAIGGAKFETKIPLVKKFFYHADKLLVIGALANDIYRYRGYKTDSSMVSEVPLDDIGDISESDKVIVPENVLVLKGRITKNKKASDVSSDEKIVDAGRGTTKAMKKIINEAKMIIWNGPFGMYEQGFTSQTKKFANLLAKSGAVTMVGGGDTLASLKEEKIEDKFTFVSTAGGAMLEFMEKETLVGITALQEAS
ncbi:MAG: phosphoglycerate kinase [Candidatus Paceibacteria bacterium]|jgi:phosphoglycerate kinase